MRISVIQFDFVIMFVVAVVVVVALAAGKMELHHYFQENRAFVRSIY
jgi:hypothetical protein